MDDQWVYDWDQTIQLQFREANSILRRNSIREKSDLSAYILEIYT